MRIFSSPFPRFGSAISFEPGFPNGLEVARAIQKELLKRKIDAVVTNKKRRGARIETNTTEAQYYNLRQELKSILAARRNKHYKETMTRTVKKALMRVIQSYQFDLKDRKKRPNFYTREEAKTPLIVRHFVKAVKEPNKPQKC